MTDVLHGWLDAVRAGVVAAGSAAGRFAGDVQILPTTGSTNDDVARAAAAGAPEGYTVIAAEQTAGRGRRGAAWHSPAAHGLYCSLLLRPANWPVVVRTPSSPAPGLVTLMAGVAVARAIGDVCGMRVELKWPNDVMVRVAGDAWRKLAGILAEGASDGTGLKTIVLGIGINILRTDAPPDVASRMVALMDSADRLDDRLAQTVSGLVTAVLMRLEQGVARLSRGALDDVRADWASLAPTVDGTQVEWDVRGARHEGVTRGIDDDGGLRVEIAPDRFTTVHGGDVIWRLGGAPA